MTLGKVLLVEDNDEIGAVYREGLENSAFDVTTTGSATSARRLIMAQQFDVLLYDLHAAETADVFDVVRALRHTNPKAVILVLSRNAELHGGLSALLLRTCEVLVKPTRMVTIIERIRNGLLTTGPHLLSDKYGASQLGSSQK
ncbi:MAG: response regulator [Candidatus Acidiferrum sp.]